MLGFLFISFLAGVLTVLAPCILPMLPVVIGGSFDEKPQPGKVAVIVISLAVSVLLFTLLLKVSTAFIFIPQLFWQIVSGGLLIIFGLSSLIPSWWDRIPGIRALYRASNKAIGSGYRRHSLLGDIVIGAALGPVFSSCSPTYFVILAAVLPVHLGTGILYLLAYVLGLSLFLFLIAFLGQKAVARLGLAADPHGWFRRTIAILFVLVGVGILFGIDKRLEAALPAGAFGEIGWEQGLLGTHTDTGNSGLVSGRTPVADASGNVTATPAGFLTLAEKSLRYPKAPELVSPDGYVNTLGTPITLAQYRGKNVVLVDFWDYSCINCQRTIPYLNAWYQKYKDQGLVIIGVHTPEFAFEHLLSNVEAATSRFGIQYPVILDNRYQTWNAYQNQFWPREYLIDIDGYIVHDHAGEGDYEGSEQAIQRALGERAMRLGTTTEHNLPISATMPAPDLSAIGSPETYFGSARNELLGNGRAGQQGKRTFVLPTLPESNTLYLGGSWNIVPEYAEAGPGATIEYTYTAGNVYMVATNPDKPVQLKIFRDGKPVGAFVGSDVDSSTSLMNVNGDRLYHLIHESTPGTHTLKIEIEGGTLDAYTFTFG